METAPRPRPRPRHAVPDTDLVHTDVIDPELVERVGDTAPRDVVDAEIVEDEHYSPRPAAPTGEAIAQIAPPRPAPGPEPAPSAPAATKRERAGRADLRLLRANPSLRARCAAALVLPFVIYTIVLVVISRVDVYLLWIWIPAIVAGVLFGAQLDAAHKAARPTE